MRILSNAHLIDNAFRIATQVAPTIDIPIQSSENNVMDQRSRISLRLRNLLLRWLVLIVQGAVSASFIVQIAVPAAAQVLDPGPSDPSLFTTVVNIPPAQDIGYSQSSNGSVQFNVSDGGSIGSSFRALSGSEVNISGGTLGTGFRSHGAEVHISGGDIGTSYLAGRNSKTYISGGNIASFFNATEDSEVNISGGRFGKGFFARFGSNVSFIGGEFRLNGQELTTTSLTLTGTDTLTGTLADGSTFILNELCGDNIRGTLTLANASLPSLNTMPTIIDSPVTSGSSGLRAGQTLTLQPGGALRNSYAVVGGTLNIEGGTLGEGAETAFGVVNISGGNVERSFYAYANSEVNITGGTVGEDFRVQTGTKVNISGGTIGDYFEANVDSVVNLFGGTVGNRFNANSGSVVNIYDGNVGHSFEANRGSQVNFYGGQVVGFFSANADSLVTVNGGNLGFIFTARQGSEVNINGGIFGMLSASSLSLVNVRGGRFDDGFTASSDSEVNLFGKEFSLNGIPLDSLTPGQAVTITDRDVTLSGVLADGSPFSFDLNPMSSSSEDYFHIGSTLTITLVPEPTAIMLLLLGTTFIALRRWS